jgi:hypothetical protein
MIKKWFFSLLLSFPFVVQTLEVQPWFGGVYEFHFLSGYTYDYYRQVQGAVPPLRATSNDHHLFFDLDYHATPYWDFDIDLHFLNSPRKSFGFETSGVQFRYLWMDDIVGDPITLVTGLLTRYVSDSSLRDVSSPYHGPFEFVANIALGNEFVDNEEWRARLWLFGALGQATIGSPWLQGIFGFDTNVHETHKLSIYVDAMQGFGTRQTIDINHFHGYGRVRQKSIDLGFRYGYQLGVWGTLKFTYQRRVLAKLCPKNVNSFEFAYLLPFSF